MKKKHFLWLFCLLLPSTAIPQPDQTQTADPYGLGMSMIAMFVVFMVLIFLYLMFKSVAGFFLRAEKKIVVKELLAKGHAVPSEEEAAAIGIALHLYQKEMRDHEEMKLTIARVSKPYSPWSSKIYGVGVVNKH